MLLGNLLLLLAFPPDILIFLSGLPKTGQKPIENAKEFVALARGWVLAEQPTHPVKLRKTKTKQTNEDVKQTWSDGIFLRSKARHFFLTLAFMSTKRSSSSAKRTDAVPVNSFITGKYLEIIEKDVRRV